MSVQNVSTIIGKAVTDHKYRDLLFSNPNQALKGYDLTPEETKGLTEGITRAEFDKIATQLEERIAGQVVGGASNAQATGQALKQLSLGKWGAMVNCY